MLNDETADGGRRLRTISYSNNGIVFEVHSFTQNETTLLRKQESILNKLKEDENDNSKQGFIYEDYQRYAGQSAQV